MGIGKKKGDGTLYDQCTAPFYDKGVCRVVRHNMPPRVLSIVVFHCEEIAVTVKFQFNA